MSVPAGAVHAARLAPSGAQRPMDVAATDSAAAVAAEGPVPTAQLQGQADRCYAQEWSAEEQRTLELGLVKWPQERTPALERYLRIAATLPTKSARDVALRVRWMQRFAQQKRRVSAVYQDPDTNRAAQRPRQGHTGSIFAQAQPAPAAGPAPANGVPQQPSSTLPVVNPYQIPANMLVMPSMMPDGTMLGTMAPGGMPGMASLPMQALQPYGGLLPSNMPPLPAQATPPPTMTLDDHGSGGVGGVDGPIAALLATNYSILDTFKQNMQTWRVNENTELLMQFRDNILGILNHMTTMGGVMADMPPLPVRMNVEMANNFLPRGPHGLGMPPYNLQMPMMGMFPSGIPGVPAQAVAPSTSAAAAAPPQQTALAATQAAGYPAGMAAPLDAAASVAHAASGQLAAAVDAVTAALPAGVAQPPKQPSTQPPPQQQQQQQQQSAVQPNLEPGSSLPTAVVSSQPAGLPATVAMPSVPSSSAQAVPVTQPPAAAGAPAADSSAAAGGTAVSAPTPQPAAAPSSAGMGAGAAVPAAAATTAPQSRAQPAVQLEAPPAAATAGPGAFAAVSSQSQPDARPPLQNGILTNNTPQAKVAGVPAAADVDRGPVKLAEVAVKQEPKR